ncbi:MAG: hypothetical protein WC729_01840 [Sphingomonas sp.]|uniref:hypothetical protein n=1 Tax=Sphingomonas sp. TaxID=28214 RepID=UPI003564F2C5
MPGRNLARGVVALAAAGLLWLVLANSVAAGMSLGGDHAGAANLAPDAERLSLRAQQLYFEKDYGGALTLARQALRLSPIQTRAIRVAGMAELALGQEEAGLRAMNAAALGGWRDNPTQLWTMQMALYGGDEDTAMQRADALVRRATVPDQVFAAFRAMAGDDAFRRSLIGRLTDQPDWRELMFLDLRRSAPAELPGVIALIGEIDRTSQPVSDRELFPLVERLLELGQVGPAFDLWHARAPRAGRQSGNHVYDGGFAVALARRSAPAMPRFEWAIDPDATGLATVEPAPDGSGAVLRARSDAGVAATLATETLALAPGRYALTMDIAAPSERDLAGFAIVVRCPENALDLTKQDPNLRALGSDRLHLATAIDVPTGCARQDLVIRARGGTPVGATIEIDNVAIRPAG